MARIKIKTTPCVFIQLDSANFLVVQRQIEKMLRLCAFRLGCVVDIYGINWGPIPVEHVIKKFVSERAERICSDIYPKRSSIVRLEWPKEEEKIYSRIIKTFMSYECDNVYSFTTYKDEDINIFQFFQVSDQPWVYSEAIASKGKTPTDESGIPLKTIYFLCAFDATRQYSKAPE